MDTLTNTSQYHPNWEVRWEIPEVECEWWHKCWCHVLIKYRGVVVNLKKNATGGGGAKPKYMEKFVCPEDCYLAYLFMMDTDSLLFDNSGVVP